MNKITLNNVFYAIIGISIFAFIIYLGYRVVSNEQRIITISMVALLAGVLYESLRVSEKKSLVAYIFIACLIFSLFAFLPTKHENIYKFEKHLAVWPYIFLILFISLSALLNSEKTIVKLGEGITLLQSISIIYWTFDYGFLNMGDWYIKPLIGIGLVFATFAIFNALTNFSLSPKTRFVLSIWSSIIMLLFGIDNTYRVYQNHAIEMAQSIPQGLFMGLQFFLLGASSIYIVQNAMMLIILIPGKDTFFNEQYFKDLKEHSQAHIARYSDQQVFSGYAILCIAITGSIYWLNYTYHLLPRNMMIWSIFLLFPILVKFIAINSKSKN
jgi:hypothetical protein